MQDEAEDTELAEAVSDMLNALLNAAYALVHDEKAIEHAFFTQLIHLIKVRCRVTHVLSMQIAHTPEVHAEAAVGLVSTTTVSSFLNRQSLLVQYGQSAGIQLNL